MLTPNPGKDEVVKAPKKVFVKKEVTKDDLAQQKQTKTANVLMDIFQLKEGQRSQVKEGCIPVAPKDATHRSSLLRLEREIPQHHSIGDGELPNRIGQLHQPEDTEDPDGKVSLLLVSPLEGTPETSDRVTANSDVVLLVQLPARDQIHKEDHEDRKDDYLDRDFYQGHEEKCGHVEHAFHGSLHTAACGVDRAVAA